MWSITKALLINHSEIKSQFDCVGVCSIGIESNIIKQKLRHMYVNVLFLTSTFVHLLLCTVNFQDNLTSISFDLVQYIVTVLSIRLVVSSQVAPFSSR